MKVNIFQGNTSIPLTAGPLIIIDVLRAGATAHYILNEEIKKCILAKDKNMAFELAKGSDVVLIGEKNGYKIEGFDLGNSPCEISKEKSKLAGKTVIFLTTNGVTTINNNMHFPEIYLCGFVNARYTANYLKKKTLEDITIIASHPTSDDDMSCAEYIKGLITKKNKVSKVEVEERIKNSLSAKKFYDDKYFPIEDLNICSKEIINPGFVIKAVVKNGCIILTKIENID